MERAKVLVIEDEEDIRELVSLHLKRQGLDVRSVESDQAAGPMLEAETFSVIVVDWMLPGASGIEIVRSLRESEDRNRATPILMLTAKGEAEDIVEGLNAGADDYLTKPFEIPVLVARVNALLRRVLRTQAQESRVPEEEELLVGTLRVRPKRHEVFCKDQRVDLTPYEFKMLLALMDARGSVLTRAGLIERVQGAGVRVIDRAVDTHVFGLRKKLGACANWIETVRGVGYRLKWDEKAE